MAARVPPIPAADLTPDQQRIHDAIAGARGGSVGGPFAIWLRIPEIAERANHFSDRIRSKSKVERRLFELMVIAVARAWSAQYEWLAHARQGEAAGLSPAVVEAIRQRRTPVFERDDERLVFDTVTELSVTRTLSQATYDRALAAFGQDLLIELITGAGFYTMIAMMLNAFDVPAPGGAHPLD
jgi:4-carboxymuconolactone decarboxylase